MKEYVLKPKASALDVAQFILEKKGDMSPMKLQKLVYYCQAWSLVFDDRPMYHEPVQAWVHGPVIPELYQKHRGTFEISAKDVNGNIHTLDGEARKTVDGILEVYGDQTPFTLRLLTHQEPPWLEARKGLDPEDRSSREISLESMNQYYSTLVK